MLALKTEQLGPALSESNRDGSAMFRSGCMLLEAVTGTIVPRYTPLCCVVCQWLPRSPVTLPCGYTGCKRCLGQQCPHCGGDVPPGLEQNVLVKAATEKWWPKELEAECLREQGVALAQEDLLEEAIGVFDTAVNLCGEDHLLLEARSEVLHKLNRLELSLEDATKVTRIRPFWSKGYYRKGVVLTSLGEYEDAFVSFALCAALEKNCDRVKPEFIKILQKLVSPTSKRVPVSPWWSSNYITPLEPTAKTGEDDIIESFNRTVISSFPMFESRKLNLLLDRIFQEIENTKKIEFYGREMLQDSDLIDPEDFECVLCCRTLWRPVTTPCGHTYCAVCLDRSLDYSPNCPLCMTSLSQYVGSNERQVTVFLEMALSIGLPSEYHCRLSSHRAELAALSSVPEIPVFVCTTAYPTVSCPLYVFEPRYRLMIRRCVESGTRQFGMAAYTHQPSGAKRYAEYGTILEIKDWVLLNDGCSILSCVGVRRFRVISRSERDGYDTAQVQFIQDDPISCHSLQEVKELHDRVRKRGLRWFQRMSQDMQMKIVGTFGKMPEVEDNWHCLENGPAWAWWLVAILPLGHHLQVGILKTTCFSKRLRAIEKTLKHFEEGPESRDRLQNANIDSLKNSPNNYQDRRNT
ncbi:LON peptidase N-terminal domain and RING finger protein 2 [Halyomorpha halys]|uniref:LON peptidase N-terminal domain and RING finger protein 2 n=1 Tax=Halyomorpha halys TaxID=286706 RepID=UPI0006D4F73F|nr:LON peptidase N-terminal domain and RING finger protein 2 [Halyomorpha halys]